MRQIIRILTPSFLILLKYTKIKKKKNIGISFEVHVYSMQFLFFFVILLQVLHGKEVTC